MESEPPFLYAVTASLPTSTWAESTLALQLLELQLERGGAGLGGREFLGDPVEVLDDVLERVVGLLDLLLQLLRRGFGVRGGGRNEHADRDAGTEQETEQSLHSDLHRRQGSALRPFRLPG